jgi:hypothetical protein
MFKAEDILLEDVGWNRIWISLEMLPYVTGISEERGGAETHHL